MYYCCFIFLFSCYRLSILFLLVNYCYETSYLEIYRISKKIPDIFSLSFHNWILIHLLHLIQFHQNMHIACKITTISPKRLLFPPKEFLIRRAAASPYIYADTPVFIPRQSAWNASFRLYIQGVHLTSQYSYIQSLLYQQFLEIRENSWKSYSSTLIFLSHFKQDMSAKKPHFFFIYNVRTVSRYPKTLCKRTNYLQTFRKTLGIYLLYV